MFTLKKSVLRASGLGVVILAFTVLSVYAHTVGNIDGDPEDWANLGNGTCPAPPADLNWSLVTVNTSNQSDCGLADDGETGTERVWSDPQSDERTDFSNPDARVDIRQFRVTGDETYLYFYVKMQNIDQATGNGAPQVQIAIDTDQTSGSGNTAFGGFADDSVDNAAGWERLVITRFGSNNTSPYVYNTSWTDQANANTLNAISTTNDVIEIRVPWSILGTGVGPGSTLRFTVDSFRCNASDVVWDVGGDSTSDALDAVTTTSGGTWNEVSDQTNNYYYDIMFQSPTAITLSSFTAASALPSAIPWLAGAALALGGALAWRRKRR